MAHERSNDACPSTGTPPFSQNCRQYAHAKCLFVTPIRAFAREPVERRPDGQPQMREDALDHCGLLNGRDELQLPATVRAVLEVDVEHALQQLRPTHAPLRAASQRKRLRRGSRHRADGVKIRHVPLEKCLRISEDGGLQPIAARLTACASSDTFRIRERRRLKFVCLQSDQPGRRILFVSPRCAAARSTAVCR